MTSRFTLPVLPNVRVASHCTADWNGMAPVDITERVRHCASCDKHVYNLSSLTRAEAEALIVAKEGKLCVRYYQRKDGTILLADCTVGASAAKKRKLIAAGAAALLVGGAALTLARHEDPPSVAASVEQSTSEDVPIEARELPAVAHDDPPPPAPVIPPVVPPDDWDHVQGIMIMDHATENPLEDL